MRLLPTVTGVSPCSSRVYLRGLIADSCRAPQTVTSLVSPSRGMLALSNVVRVFFLVLTHVHNYLQQ